ncbi:unnamed protein product, partial [Gulo gulo]
MRCQWGWLALHLVPLSQKPFPHVCVCPCFRLLMKGVYGRSWMHFPLYSVEKGGRQTTALQSHFPWSSPPFLVLKVEDGEWLSRHLCSSSLAWLELEVRAGHKGPR